MATGVLFIGWGQAIPGREQKALEVFGEAVKYWTGLQQQGAIDRFDPVVLEPHGGELAGFTVIFGDEAKLNQLRITPEFMRLNQRAGLVVTHFGAVMGFTGDSLTKQFADFGGNAAQLA